MPVIPVTCKDSPSLKACHSRAGYEECPQGGGSSSSGTSVNVRLRESSGRPREKSGKSRGVSKFPGNKSPVNLRSKKTHVTALSPKAPTVTAIPEKTPVKASPLKKGLIKSNPPKNKNEDKVGPLKKTPISAAPKKTPVNRDTSPRKLESRVSPVKSTPVKSGYGDQVSSLKRSSVQAGTLNNTFNVSLSGGGKKPRKDASFLQQFSDGKGTEEGLCIWFLYNIDLCLCIYT